jgi:hypothetical protein
MDKYIGLFFDNNHTYNFIICLLYQIIMVMTISITTFIITALPIINAISGVSMTTFSFKTLSIRKLIGTVSIMYSCLSLSIINTLLELHSVW